jgi:selenocysteine-specific elongation factor
VYVVSTAGHVDHGKSTLVRALTGQDPDRLEEEHRRGLSIELGYCWTWLDPVGDVAFVDVPGHERFLSTTLAGLGPASVALLVVAADDPWMPQAAEHLAAIDAFGIEHGVLVVTRCDLADPAPALLRARAEVDRTTLAGAPDVTVSGRTGAGLGELRATLGRVLTEVARDDRADVRYWVDRIFTVPGAGTVVTGTLPAGTVRVGDELAFGDARVRVRGLESLGRDVRVVTGPARMALRLGGHVPDGLHRGAALVTPDAYGAVTELDVRLHGEGRPPERPLLHVGSGRIAAHVRLLDESFARVRLASPLPLRHGDRLVLRDPGSRSLWGADVLDAQPPSLARRGSARQRAVELTSVRPGVADELRRRGFARRSRLRQLGVDTSAIPATVSTYGDWLVSAEQLEAWRSELLRLLSGDPGGLTAEAAARELGVPDTQLMALISTPPVVVRSGRLLLDDGLAPGLSDALEAISATLAEDPFQAPDAPRLGELGLDGSAIARLARDGHLLALGSGVVLLPGADTTAYVVLDALPQPFTPSQAGQALHATRRVTLPLLNHLDRTGRTVRLPDGTRRTVRRPG